MGAALSRLGNAGCSDPLMLKVTEEQMAQIQALIGQSSAAQQSL
jgi:hypothetical protein